MALEEFNEFKLGCNVPTSFPTMFTAAADAIPMLTRDQINQFLAGKANAWDRRSQFPANAWIKDQANHGSCNGYSIAAALEKLRTLRGLERVVLSGADAYSQMNGGHDNGSSLADGMQIVQANGIAPEELNPGPDRIYTSQISAAAKAARSRFKGFECYAVDSEEELATGIILGFMGVIAVHVSRGFDNLDSDGCPSSGNGVGNHSVHVDDVRLTTGGELQFDSPNNWRVTWGDQGRCRYRWNQHLKQTVNNHRFYITRSTNDDPQGTNPPAAS